MFLQVKIWKNIPKKKEEKNKKMLWVVMSWIPKHSEAARQRGSGPSLRGGVTDIKVPLCGEATMMLHLGI